eukprot:8335960-Pyramimonas_sp.AAC.1
MGGVELQGTCFEPDTLSGVGAATPMGQHGAEVHASTATLSLLIDAGTPADTATPTNARAPAAL